MEKTGTQESAALFYGRHNLMWRKECIKVLPVNIYCLGNALVYILMQRINAKEGTVGGKEGWGRGGVWRELEGS